jgi:DNA (cytosine-5)-methyltransferase 1
MNELALFAGAGGGILGGKLLGWRTVCAVEWEPYPASVLCARQNDGLLPPFPIWDDVQTFDGKPWRGIVDVVSGGFPCQDISAAGRGAGIDGERSGMWREMARIIHEVRPRYAFVENSPMLTSRGLGTVLGDLASMGFDARWGVLGAVDVGANHKRDRIWIVAKWNGQLSHTQHDRIGRWEQQQESIEKAPRNMAYPRRKLRQTRESIRLDADAQIGSTRAIHNQPSGEGQASLADTPGVHAQRQHSRPWEIQFGRKSWWETEPDVGRVANGLAAGVDRLKAIGNGQVPLCAATAWQILTKDI